MNASTSGGVTREGRDVRTPRFQLLSGAIDFGEKDGEPIPGGRKMTIMINLIQGKIGGVTTALATGIPSEIRIHGSGVRRIVWELDHATIGSATYDFEQTSGILILTDRGTQLPRSNGGLGDGGGGFPSSRHFHFLHRNDVAKSEATYFPIIRQTIKGQVSLSGAADPKIVND